MIITYQNWGIAVSHGYYPLPGMHPSKYPSKKPTERPTVLVSHSGFPVFPQAGGHHVAGSAEDTIPQSISGLWHSKGCIRHGGTFM